VGYEEIKTIQFKRGKKEVLEARLVEGDLGIPKASEPIHEYDTGKLKFGDGVTAYIDLPYFGEKGEDPRFVIEDPLSGQILIYDAALSKWVNKDLADSESIIYLAERGLTLKGYDEAQQGQMLVKDAEHGITWINPPSVADINTMQGIAVRAEQAAVNSANSASEANTYATNAEISAQNATRINQTTMNWVNEKFWWGTVDAYHEEIAENGLNPEAFYFIKISN
jgi:hypothetical protein